ncbi:MAG: hypothetical protein ACK4UJ_08580 [Leptonema sp. (in: bacteria)]
MKHYPILLIILFPFTLFSENRIFKYNGPIQTFIPKFIDELAESKVKFQIIKNYNEATEGRLGFRMYILPGRRLVDLQFINENNKTTTIKIFFENAWDGKVFEEIFLKLKAYESDSKPFDDSLPEGWPKPN